jgi:hypothetical protein
VPLTKKGEKVMKAMREQYGDRAERVFYSSVNAGKLKGVEKKEKPATKNGRKQR